MSRTFNFADPLVTVPVGKRLVVEFVSGNIITSGTPALSLQAAGFGHLVVGTTVRSSDDTLYRFSQPLRMYVNAGESLFAESTAQFAEVSVTGYFIDVP